MHAQKTRDAGVAEESSRSFPLWLFALFLLAFSFGTDDMVIAGVLPDIARDLDVSVAASGQLVTVFALTFALGAPVAAAVTARVPRRGLLAGAAAVFVLANLGAAAAPGYGAVLVARVVAGLAAATASPAAFAVAAAAAPEGRRGRFLAAVSAGMTTSLVAGVPVGTWIGDALGWRATMLYVAALAAVAGVVLAVTLPGLPGAAPARGRLRALRRPGTAVALAAMVPAGAGGMMSYVYITEIAGRLGDVRGAAVAPVITAAGVAGVAGAFLGGRAVDVLGAPKALVVFMAGVAAAPASMAVLGAAGGPYPAVVVGAVFVFYGLVTWGIAPATQAWLLDRGGPDAAGELLAVNNACMYLGFSLAGGVGGLALGAGGAAAVPVAAAGCAGLSLVLFAAALVGRRDADR